MSIFDKKIAVVTGAASGIGRALAENMARKGAEVVLADVQFDTAATIAAGIRALGGKASAHPLDVTDSAAVENFVEATASKMGRLDYMFNNAGITINGEFRYFSTSDWKDIVDVNVSGVFAGTAAAYAVMIRQREGHIVNMASVSGLIPAPGIVAYSASKHAVVGLSTSLRAEAAHYGIKVSVVCPGFVDTPILDSKRVGKNLAGGGTTDRISKVAMTPDACVARLLKGVEKNKAVIPITAHAKGLWVIHRCFPGLLRVGARLLAKKLN